MASFNSKKTAFARERLTVTSAVKQLTPSLYNDAANNNSLKKFRASGARIALSTASGDIHFTEDGTDPTASVAVGGVGTVAGARDVIYCESYEALSKLKMFAITATDAIVEVTYYR